MKGSKELFSEMREQGLDVDCSGQIFEEPKPMSNIDKALMYFYEMHDTWRKLGLLLKSDI